MLFGEPWLDRGQCPETLKLHYHVQYLHDHEDGDHDDEYDDEDIALQHKLHCDGQDGDHDYDDETSGWI